MRNSGRRRPRLIEIVEDGAPGLGALAAHALDREQHLLAVLAHAEDDEQRDRGRLAVEPDPHHGAVEDQPHDRLLGERAGVPGLPVALHLPPYPAHRVLADRAAEQGCERAADPARVGAGEIGAGDQRVGSKRAPLVGPQRLALPLRRLAVGGVEPGARDRDLDPAEGSHQRPRRWPCRWPVAPIAPSPCPRRLRTAGVARARQRRVELALDHPLDELAHPIAHPGLDRIEPVVEKINSRFGRRLRGIRLRGIARHGVVSGPTLQRRMIRG